MLRLALLLISLSWTPTPALADEVSTAVDGVSNEGADPEMMIRTAVQRLKQGDLDGADLLLDQLDPDDLPANLAIEATYQRANIRAMRRDYAQARTIYDRLSRDFPDSHRALDARFRSAELTGVLGDPKGALAGLKALGPTRGMEPIDRAKIALNEAIFTLQTGRRRAGVRRLRRALARTDADLVSYYEAKAWVVMVGAELDRVDDLEIRGSQRRMSRTLTRRGEGLRQAEQALRMTIELQEPEWVLAGLIRLAESYEDLGDDLRDAPEPDLTADQLRIYRSELDAQVESMHVRAVKYLDGGVDVAERLSWQSARADEVRAERERLIAKIEGR